MHRAGLLALADALAAEGELTGARLEGLLAALSDPHCTGDSQGYPVAS